MLAAHIIQSLHNHAAHACVHAYTSPSPNTHTHSYTHICIPTPHNTHTYMLTHTLYHTYLHQYHTPTHTSRTKPILQDAAHSPAGFGGHLSLERLREFFLQTQFVPLKYVGATTVKKQTDYVRNNSLDRKHHHHIYSQSPFTVSLSQPRQLHQQRRVYRLTSAHSQIRHSTLSRSTAPHNSKSSS